MTLKELRDYHLRAKQQGLFSPEIAEKYIHALEADRKEIARRAWEAGNSRFGGDFGFLKKTESG